MVFETWLAFFVACWLISLSPGAGAIASMSCGLQYGFRRGYWNAIGLQLALVLQIAIVAAGVGALLATSAMAFGHGLRPDQVVWCGLSALAGAGAVAGFARQSGRRIRAAARGPAADSGVARLSGECQ